VFDKANITQIVLHPRASATCATVDCCEGEMCF